MRAKYSRIDVLRRYVLDDPVVQNGKTWVLSNQWGTKTERTLSALADAFPEAKVTFRKGCIRRLTKITTYGWAHAARGSGSQQSNVHARGTRDGSLDSTRSGHRSSLTDASPAPTEPR
jgi:hypothetical protein